MCSQKPFASPQFFSGVRHVSPFRDLPDSCGSPGRRDGKASRFITADDRSAAIRLSLTVPIFRVNVAGPRYAEGLLSRDRDCIGYSTCRAAGCGQDFGRTVYPICHLQLIVIRRSQPHTHCCRRPRWHWLRHLSCRLATARIRVCCSPNKERWFRCLSGGLRSPTHRRSRCLRPRSR